MELVVASEVGGVVEDGDVDPRVVHLGDKAVGGHFKVVEQGREVLFGVDFTLVRPREPVLVPAPCDVV